VGNDVILVLVVITALAFDFTNGFHDTGNAMATSIATMALPPRVAVALSGVLNMVGAFLSLAVAATIASGLVDTKVFTLTVVAAGLTGGNMRNQRGGFGDAEEWPLGGIPKHPALRRVVYGCLDRGEMPASSRFAVDAHPGAAPDWPVPTVAM
jgi:phosphate transporter family protein